MRVTLVLYLPEFNISARHYSYAFVDLLRRTALKPLLILHAFQNPAIMLCSIALKHLKDHSLVACCAAMHELVCSLCFLARRRRAGLDSFSSLTGSSCANCCLMRWVMSHSEETCRVPSFLAALRTHQSWSLQR